MEHLAEALILATQHIDERPDDSTAHDDVKQLEGIAYILKRCSPWQSHAELSRMVS